MSLTQHHLRIYEADMNKVREWATRDGVTETTFLRQLIHKAVKAEEEKVYVFKFVAENAALPSNPDVAFVGPCIALAIAHSEDEARKTLLAYAAIDDPPIDARWLTPGCAKVIRFDIDQPRALSWFA